MLASYFEKRNIPSYFGPKKVNNPPPFLAMINVGIYSDGRNQTLHFAVVIQLQTMYHPHFIIYFGQKGTTNHKKS